MKEKKLKLKLEDIKVESFVTSLVEEQFGKNVGGSANTIPCGGCSLNTLECGGCSYVKPCSFNNTYCGTCDGQCSSPGLVC